MQNPFTVELILYFWTGGLTILAFVSALSGEIPYRHGISMKYSDSPLMFWIGELMILGFAWYPWLRMWNWI